MPWTFITHDCEIPSEEERAGYLQDSIWTCPVCKSEWVKGIEAGFWRNSFRNEEGVRRPTNPPEAAYLTQSRAVETWGDIKKKYHGVPDLSVRPTHEDDDYSEEVEEGK